MWRCERKQMQTLVEKFYSYYLHINFWWILAIFAAGIIALLICHSRSTKTEKYTIPLLVTYAAAILVFMVLARHGTGIHKYELIPFWSYQWIWVSRHILLGNLINIFLYIPVGLLLPAVTKSYRKTILIGIGYSLLIQLLQLITTTGSFETDDIIHNIIGLAIGCYICQKIRIHIHRKLRKEAQKKKAKNKAIT